VYNEIVEHISPGADELTAYSTTIQIGRISAGDGSTDMMSGPHLRIITLPATSATEQPRRTPNG
jgi:hypothetical protein